MAKLLNRVKYTSSTSGTGTLSLSTTAETGFQTFPDAGVHIKESDYRYVIENGSNFEIGTGTYSENSEVASYDPDTQVGSSDPRSITFKPDGSKMYLGTATDVYQYALSTNWDITSATYENKALGSGAYGIAFNNDGTKFYRGSGSYSAGNWYTHTLSTAYDISTSTGSTDAGTWSSSYSYAHDLAWNNDGTKFFLLRYRSISAVNYPILYEFSASTAYDASDSSLTQLDSKNEAALASYYPHDGLVWPNGQQIVSFSFNSDGTQLYLLEKFRKSVIRLNLSTAFDLSTLSFHSVTVDRNDFTSSWGLYFKDNDEIFVFGEDASNSSMVTKHDKANAVPTLTRTLTDSTTGSLINLSGDSTVFVGAAAEDYLTVNNISFGDNDVLNFGNDNDLQIYGSGSGSYVSANTSLRLKSSSETFMYVGGFSTANKRLRCSSDGEVELFYSGSQKLETTDTGVTVTGTLTADALSGDIVFEGSTADDFETTLTVTDPTADRTVTIPNQTGSVMLWQNAWPDDPDTSNGGNYAIGEGALPSLTSGGIYNLAFGLDALASVTTGDNNIGIGRKSAETVSTGNHNVAIGVQALQNCTGATNTAIGHNANQVTTSANNNVCIGGYAKPHSAGYSNVTAVGTAARASGNYTIALGYQAAYLQSASFADHGINVGYRAGYGQSGGDYNINIGRLTASSYYTSASYNINIGDYAGRQTNSASNRVSIGREAGYKGQYADGSVNLGYKAGYEDYGADYCTSIGYNAGNGGTTSRSGNYCTSIGYEAAPSSTTAAGEFTLGDSNISSLRCNVTSISTLSDRRDKTNIIDSPYGLAFINDVRPVTFDWNRRDGSMVGKKEVGFIAQELADVEIDHSSHSHTKLVSYENPEKLEARPHALLPVLVKAVQELSAKNDALEARIAQLEGD